MSDDEALLTSPEPLSPIMTIGTPSEITVHLQHPQRGDRAGYTEFVQNLLRWVLSDKPEPGPAPIGWEDVQQMLMMHIRQQRTNHPDATLNIRATDPKYWTFVQVENVKLNATDTN